MHVQESIRATMSEALQEAVVRCSHRTIVRRPGDGLCHSRKVDFGVGVSQRGDRSVVTVEGELDVHTAPALLAELDPLSRRTGAAIIVDLTLVPFIDSTGLGVLVATLKHVRESEGSLDVVVVAPRVLKVFALTGLDVVIPLHSTLDEALPPL
jgi:anti-sigma B factor antagonist